MRSTWCGAMSGRIWITTVPPFDNSRYSLFAGFAATSAGAAMLGAAGAAAGGGAAAIRLKAMSGNANRALDTWNTPPFGFAAANVEGRLTPALMAAVEVPLDVGGDRRSHELADRPAVARDFLHQLGRDRLQRHVGHQEDRFDIVVQLLVHSRHLELIFEVGDAPQAPQDRGRALLFCELHQQRIELDHLDVAGDVRDLSPDHRQSLGDREHRLLRGVGGDPADQLVYEVRAAADDVEVSERKRVERPRIDCDLH